MLRGNRYLEAVDAVRELLAIVRDGCEPSYYRDYDIEMDHWRKAIEAGQAVIDQAESGRSAKWWKRVWKGWLDG